jgi:dCTP deaminase
MIVPDHEIHKLCQPTREEPYGDLLMSNPPQRKTRTVDQVPLVDPYLPENVQPASIDVRLAHEFRVFERDATESIDLSNPTDITKLVIVPENGYFTLHPGEFVLGVTMEKLTMPDDLVARIEGKSSLGRLGLIVHATAGFIDPGFCGPVTLEMTCLHPLAIRLRPGRLIAQISLHEMTSAAQKPYDGRYQGARGVEPSKYGASRSQIELERMKRAVEDVGIERADTPPMEVMHPGVEHCDCMCHVPIGPEARDTGVHSCNHCLLIG